jgi:hypothetical protein
VALWVPGAPKATVTSPVKTARTKRFWRIKDTQELPDAGLPWPAGLSRTASAGCIRDEGRGQANKVTP